MGVKPSDVLAAFTRNARAEHSGALGQAKVKRVVVHTLDEIVGQVHGRRLRNRFWLYANRVDQVRLGATTHQPDDGESMLDVAVYAKGSGHMGDPFTVIATAESEAFAAHGVEDEAWDRSDYRWDLFKLLAVPSPLRLFVARTIRRTRGGDVDRVGLLRKRVREAVSAYAHPGVRAFADGDRFFSIVLPATGSYDDLACDGWRIEAGVALPLA